MIEKVISAQQIIDCLNINYGINVTTLTLLTLGADIDASVYKAQAHDNSTYFVKIKHGRRYDIGVIVQQLLHDAGIQEIISPLKTNNNQIIQYIGDFSLSVYPFIEGQDGFSRELTNDQWIELGKALKKIHEFKVPTSIKKQIRQETYAAQWRDIVRSLINRIESIQAHDDIALKFLNFFKRHNTTIQRLVECAEHLASRLKNLSPEFVLCHSDIHAGNVLLAQDGALYIVDWDNPIMAPKERDLMFIGGGVGNVWNNPDEAELFYAGYGETEINEDILAYYRCERIVEDIAEYSEQLLSHHQEYTSRLTGYNYFIAMFESNGVVDIALRTYDTKT